MNHLDDQFDEGDAALDHLLHQARWPEPTAEHRAALVDAWRDLAPRHPGWRIGRRSLAAAAAILLIVGGGIALLKLDRREGSPLADAQPSVPYLVTGVDIDQVPQVESRPANAYERLVIMSAKPAPRKLAAAHPPASPPNAPPVDSSVRTLVQQLNDPLVNNRFAAAKELANSNEPQVVNILTEMIDSGMNRREALAALMWSKKPQAEQALDFVRTSPVVEAQFVALKLEFQ